MKSGKLILNLRKLIWKLLIRIDLLMTNDLSEENYCIVV